MDKNTLLAKTDKGREALSSRPPELVPKLRSLLIMVDGKRNAAELDKLGAGLGGGMDLLEQLLTAGWVGAVDAMGQWMAPVTAPPVDSPVAVDTARVAPAPAAAPALSFVDARRQVVRFINDHLGPMGESIAIRVEGCKTPADLQALLPRIRDTLHNYKNTALVQRFDLEVVPLLPRH